MKSILYKIIQDKAHYRLMSFENGDWTHLHFYPNSELAYSSYNHREAITRQTTIESPFTNSIIIILPSLVLLYFPIIPYLISSSSSTHQKLSHPNKSSTTPIGHVITIRVWLFQLEGYRVDVVITDCWSTIIADNYQVVPFRTVSTTRSSDFAQWTCLGNWIGLDWI